MKTYCNGNCHRRQLNIASKTSLNSEGDRVTNLCGMHPKAWCAGVSSGSLATCLNSELRRRTIGSSTGPRPVREEKSVFRTWSYQQT